MKQTAPAGRFQRACREVLGGEFSRAARSFEVFGLISPEQFGRLGKLDSPSPKDYPQLLGQLRSYLATYPGSVWGHVFDAFAQRALMNYSQSIQAMERAVVLSPDSPILHALTARMRFVHRYPAEGVLELQKAVALAPKCGWMRSWLGEARRHTCNFRAALRDLSRGIRIDPWYAPAYTWRASVLEKLGRYQEAKRDLDRAIRLNSRDAWAYHQRMHVRRLIGDAVGGLKDARRSYLLNPKFGWIYGRPNENGAAQAALEESNHIVRRYPGSAWGRAWRGWTLMQMGRASEAFEDLSRAVKSSADPYLLVWKAEAGLRLGRYLQALQDINEAVLAGPSCAPAHARRGEILYHLSRHKDAESSLNRSLKLDPLCAWAYYWRARVRSDLGKFDAAASDLDMALGIMPNYMQAADLMGKMKRDGVFSR